MIKPYVCHPSWRTGMLIAKANQDISKIASDLVASPGVENSKLVVFAAVSNGNLQQTVDLEGNIKYDERNIEDMPLFDHVYRSAAKSFQRTTPTANFNVDRILRMRFLRVWITENRFMVGRMY